MTSFVFPVLAQTQGQGQLPSLTPEQMEILRSLPPDQRDALIEQVLGSRKGGVDRRDKQLQFPETVRPRTLEEQEALARGFGFEREPRLRAEDSILLRLEIREFKGPDPVVLPSFPLQGQAGQQVQPGVAQPPAEPRERIVRSDEETRRLEDLRDKIQKRNPYRLDRYGRLSLPELGSIPLAGLTAKEAELRLGIDEDLRDFKVDVTLLPLERLGEEGLKPFGYDLFAGTPTTFAPATDIPVPADYVVGAGDEIQVQLFGNTNKNYSLVVGRDGRINFPELGPIPVAGQRFAQVAAELEQRISSQMIGVRVSVTMGETRSIRIFVLGEAEVPGSYTVSGLSTITNALFVSGGAKKIGSLRNIQLKRHGELIRRLDLYDLLLEGDTSDDARLLPGDVIFIPPVGPTVSVTGEVRRPAIYELRDETSVEQVVRLAGGLTPEADPSLATLERVDARRQRVVVDVSLDTPAGRSLPLSAGDVLRLQPIRESLENSVELSGHVQRPGSFQYRSGMRLTDVLTSFDELRPHADTRYVLIRRELPPDRTVTVLSADLVQALQRRGSDRDVALAPRDRIIVFDMDTGRDRIVAPLIDELRLQARIDRPMQIVGVGGRVKAPGQYPLEPGMHLSDLIRAGGSLEDAAYGGQAELARYKVINGEYRQTQLLEIDLAAVLAGNSGADIQLEPYDFLNIKELPQWREQEEIEIAGEVRFPGVYPVQRGETLRSVIIRAGGLTDLAFAEGSLFLREDLRNREKEQIERLAIRLQSDIAVLALQSSAENPAAAQALSVGQSLLADLRNTKPVGRLVLDLNAMLAHAPGSPNDITLKNGDRLLIPRKTEEVTVLGEVQNTTSHVYREGFTRDDYIGLSGGTTQKADKKRIYVVHANGSVVAGSGGWFRKASTEIRPGDAIVVPLDAERMRPLPLWTAVTQIIYNLAIAAAAVSSF